MNALRAYRLGILLSLLHLSALPYKCFRNSRQAALHLAGYQRGLTYDAAKAPKLVVSLTGGKTV